MLVQHKKLVVTLSFFCFLLASCTLLTRKDESVIEKKILPVYKIGDPYQVSGVWYYPQEDYKYNENGVASWYGIDLHNKETANGEVFDMMALTAAHKTLPMPSIVRVTNLNNGRSLIVRVNDRGPFINYRLIDLSKMSAQLLGFEPKGTIQAHVEILSKESLALKSSYYMLK